MAVLKCAFPHDGFRFGHKLYDVSEAEAERLTKPDAFSRIALWVRIPDPRKPSDVKVEEKAPEAPEAEKPVEVKVEETEAPAEVPAEEPAPVEEKVEAPAKTPKKGK